MAFKIRVPDSALHTQTINVGSESYTIKFKFNTSDMAWYIQILDLEENPITADLKVMPNQNITGRFPYLQILGTGNIWCIRAKNDLSPIDRTNLGIGKIYELRYYSFQEELELGINDTIQL